MTNFNLISQLTSWFHRKDREVNTGGKDIDTGGGDVIVGAGLVDGKDISALDHGADLAGLSDDDHTQYHNNTRGDARYFQQSEFASAPGASSKPIESDSNGEIQPEAISTDWIVIGSTTLTAGQSQLVMAERSVVGTPTSGYGVLWVNTSGELWFKNDAGTATQLA